MYSTGMTKPTTLAIILAGGTGTRMGNPTPKQFLPLYGTNTAPQNTVLYHSINAFANHPAISHIAVVCHGDWFAQCHDVINTIQTTTPILPVITGGDTRQQSVYNGLLAVEHIAPDYVLIHDGARPHTPPDLIDRVTNALHKGADGVIPALPATDTLKTNTGNTITSTLNRDQIVHAQTPQGFAYTAILSAHQTAPPNLTDDASVLAQAGGTVQWVTGDPANIKITTPHDLQNNSETPMTTPQKIPRIGQGYDVHKFTDGDHVMLCGVKIPHTKAFTAHSDGDVALHALTDALYGAIAMGDIGRHFPPTDPQWQGADSAIFLQHAVDMVANMGGEIGNVDITIMCEQPKITPHAPTMQQRLSELMKIPTHKISIKATTTEKLGFTGRGEGIATTATVIVFVQGY